MPRFHAVLLCTLLLLVACAPGPRPEQPPPEQPEAPEPGASPGRQDKTAPAGEAIADHAAPALGAAAVRRHAESISMPGVIGPPAGPAGWNREGYDHIAENRFRETVLSPLSTFGLDVDTASYGNLRRYLSQGQLPPADALRIEEMINYFDYDYPAPTAGELLAVSTEVSVAPWNPAHRLALIGVRARSLAAASRPANRLVFLIDTSGSMHSADKLPLLKRAFQLLIEQLGPEDSVAIVTYAGRAGLVLPATPGSHKEAMYAALNRLQAGGSTAGSAGIALAYDLAERQFLPGGNNRVILATDGDFNVGPSSQGELVRLIEARRDAGIFLTVLGFGTGNYQDGRMQALAGHGNGSHHYIDTDREAERVFRDKLAGTLYTVAKDVKLQIEWNPSQVAQYRLIGYENRLLAAEDFVDDSKDAGDVGAGHTVTALYELVPAEGEPGRPSLRYQQRRPATRHDGELGQIKLRYKAPQARDSVARQTIIRDRGVPLAQASANLRWAASVAELGLVLRASEHRGNASIDEVIARASVAVGQGGDAALRREFIGLARQAKVAGQQSMSQR